jgi:hypothetical protein
MLVTGGAGKLARGVFGVMLVVLGLVGCARGGD